MVMLIMVIIHSSVSRKEKESQSGQKRVFKYDFQKRREDKICIVFCDPECIIPSLNSLS